METNTNVFSNSEITVTFNPCVCTHAEHCLNELSNVFRNSIIPWIDLDGASTQKIIAQVRKCPSKALQFHAHKKKVA